MSRQSDNKVAVSVLIPVHGEHESIMRCLQCLAEQDFGEPFEIVLGADRDLPPAPAILETYPAVRVGYCEPGAGPGGARNAAMAMARGDIFLLTDADCLPARDWIRMMTEAVRERGGRPVRGWVQTGRTWTFCQRASDFAEMGSGKPRKPAPLPGWMGSNMGCGRTWYDAGARFEEFVYGGEEIVFLSQFDEDARDVVLYPQAKVIHDDRMGYRRAYTRMYRMGVGSGTCRRRIAMRGSFFARRPWTAFLLAPARLALAVRRMPGCTLRSNLELILLLPLVFPLWCAYARGFARGARNAAREDAA